MNFVFKSLLICISLLLLNSVEVKAGLMPARLKTEYLVNPLGIDEIKPRLFWQVESEERGQRQSAYQILVATSSAKLSTGQADMWDSGKVESGETIHIVYQGKPLSSRTTYFWAVKVWDKYGQASAWSQPAFWSMGILKEQEWKAQYISFKDTTPVHKDNKTLFLPPARYYRKEFTANRKVTKATLYSTALGIYNMEINGQPVSGRWFAPGWTDYRQRAYYVTDDVTALVQSGKNALGATVADGWYSGYVGFGLLTGIGTEKIGRYTYGKTPALMAQLEVQYDDGSIEIIATDSSWQVTGNGPLREADLIMGEGYDARLEMQGWSQAGFDTAAWEQAILAQDNGHQPAKFYEFTNPAVSQEGDKSQGQVKIQGRDIDLGFKRPKLEAFPGVPVKITQELKAVSINPLSENKQIINLGQNFAGTIRLKIKGPAGHKVTIRYGEMLHQDGRLMTENLRKARVTDYYICKGDPAGEIYIPRYTFHGFQYVELNDFPGKVDLETVTGLVLHSDTPLTSTFECSDKMVNQLFSNVVWTQRANFLDLPTDCPQRDERMGWTGDAQAYVGTAAYNADIGAFYTKWLRELMESQRPSGAFPGYAPFPFQHGQDFGTAWADAGVICPWTIWQVYGDTRVIEHCWEPMTKFMNWHLKTSKDHLGVAHGNAWGDWLSQGENTPLEYVDSIYLAVSLKMMSEMAKAINKTKEADFYAQEFQLTKAAFQKHYLKSDGSITVSTQTAHALALYANLVPEELRSATGQHLAKLIADNGNHMATGFLGTKPLLPVLSASGQHDLACFLLQSHEFPSWGYEIDQGANTIWERWDSYTKEDAFGRHNAAMNSFAHYAFGAVCEWMFRTLAGIDSTSPGYAHIRIKPNPPSPGSNGMYPPVDWVKASYDSIRGKISSEWRINNDQFELQVTIPANTTASVFISAEDMGSITEGVTPISKHEYVKVIGHNGNMFELAVESGSYQFYSSSGLKPAKIKLVTSAMKDRSQNPDKIDLNGAIRLIHWDFDNESDVKKWADLTRVKIEKRGNDTYVVGTGDDPQMSIILEQPISGNLAIEIKAKPPKGNEFVFFWASPNGGFNPQQQKGRTVNEAKVVNSYLFEIKDKKLIGKLRFDPFSTLDPDQSKSEMLIKSITIYQLPE